MATNVRISVGFHAAPPLSLRVSEEALTALRGALGSDGWHELETDDGTVTVNLAQVIYLRTEKDEQRVGFGLGS